MKELVINAEVLQEILHRHVAIGRRKTIQPAFGALLRSALLRILGQVLADNVTGTADEIPVFWRSQ